MVLSKIFKVVSLASPTPKRKDGGGGPLFSSERTPVDLHVNQILNFIINSIQKTKKIRTARIYRLKIDSHSCQTWILNFNLDQKRIKSRLIQT